MWYNENYQTGIIQVYQFLINNAGDVEKYKDTNSFYLSRYSKYYHQDNQSMRDFLITWDIVYLMLLIFITIRTIIVIKSRIMDIFNYKAFTFRWFDILDITILSLIYTNLVFWILIFWVFEEVTVPFTSESKFQDYVDHSDNTSTFRIISSVLFLKLSLRLFRIITERFPSFGALFETVKVALKDLASFFVAMIIMAVGFSISTCLLFGDSISDLKTVWSTLVRLLFILFGDEGSALNSSSSVFTFAVKFYVLIFIFTFSIILMKMFITIVIIRYKYLRSIIQIDNEAHARILAEKGEELKKRLWNLFTCK